MGPTEQTYNKKFESNWYTGKKKKKPDTRELEHFSWILPRLSCRGEHSHLDQADTSSNVYDYSDLKKSAYFVMELWKKKLICLELSALLIETWCSYRKAFKIKGWGRSSHDWSFNNWRSLELSTLMWTEKVQNVPPWEIHVPLQKVKERKEFTKAIFVAVNWSVYFYFFF